MWSLVAERIDPVETMPVSPHARATRRALWMLAVTIMAFLYVPIVLLVLFSFNEPRTPGLPITRLTLDWYEVALTNRILLDAVRNSIIVAALVAAFATIIGTMAAFTLVRGRIRFPGAARVFATLPIMLPGMLLGIALLIFMRRVLDLQLSLVTVVAGHLVLTVPFVILIVAARLQGFDRNLEWAAADLEADAKRTVRHVILPLIWPAVVAGALISVTLSIDEFVVTFFTVGPQSTLPLYIYTQIKFEVTPEVNAIATVMLAATLGLLLAAWGVVALRRRLRVRGEPG
jgi:ABC-type spermidine/putrescine transport system permease subunit II